MGVQDIRQRYAMPWLKRGLFITVAWRPGRVVGFHGPWIRVRFEGAPWWRSRAGKRGIRTPPGIEWEILRQRAGGPAEHERERVS